VVTNAALTRTGITGAAYTNAFADACRSAAYYIDTSTDELLTWSNGALTAVGALGVDADGASDLEIATDTSGNNTGYAVLMVGGAATSYQIDLATGTAASSGPVTLLDSGESVRDTTILPPSGAVTQAAGDVFASTESGKLLSFNSALPGKVCTSASFAGQAADEKIVGIDVRPADQALYALGSGGHVYTVDKATAALTLTSTLNAGFNITNPYTSLSGTTFGFDFNPGNNDLIRVVSDTGMNLHAVSATGVVVMDTNLTPTAIAGEAAYGNNFAGVNLSSYYVIDSATDSLKVVGRSTGTPNNGDVTTIGTTLDVGDISAVAGFDIFGTTNVGLAALNTTGASSSGLYTINLSTGKATLVGGVGGGERVNGLAYGRTPVATVFALTSDNHLVSFKPLAPGSIDSDVAISGLAGGENIVGMDFRPADGQLYALTDQAHLYVVNTTTGAVSGSVTLAKNDLDLTAPVYAGLSGTKFGVDFSSSDDTLHVQSDTGQSLRVNPTSGAVSADGNLNVGGAATGSVSTAITSSYVGALPNNNVVYGLDVAGNRLLLQNSAGSGAQTGRPLSAGPFQTDAGFDIAGGENGLQLAALKPMGATTSTLYRVTTGGLVTAIGAIGPGGAELSVRDIAIQLK